MMHLARTGSAYRSAVMREGNVVTAQGDTQEAAATALRIKLGRGQ